MTSSDPRRRNFTVLRAERVSATGGGLYESPIWPEGSDHVFWVDIANHLLCRMPVAGGSLTHMALPCAISAIVPRRGGGMMAAGAGGFWTLDVDGDRAILSNPVPCPGIPPQGRMNDGACDRQGRFWAGTLASDPGQGEPAGRLYSLDADHGLQLRPGRFRTQNGLAWSPDGRQIYVSDSHPSCPQIRVHDFDPATGSMGEPRLLAEGRIQGGRPDGAAMDEDGGYWIAASDSGRVLRITPAGDIDMAIEVDVPNPTNICFAGRDLRQAFVTTLSAGGTGPGGYLYAVALPVAGYPETPFASRP